MPIRCTISHEERLVVATTDGVVTLKDVENYLDAVLVAGAMPYAKLFDATNIEPRATDDDMMLLGARMSAYGDLPSGPIAFVITTAAVHEFVRRYLNLTPAKRPAKIFSTVPQARQWLEAQRS